MTLLSYIIWQTSLGMQTYGMNVAGSQSWCLVGSVPPRYFAVIVLIAIPIL